MKKFILSIFIYAYTQFGATAQQLDFDTLQTSNVTDADGNVYKTILFGNTWWMASNLRTKHYNDGSVIVQMTELISESDEENNWDWWAGVGRWGYPNLDPTTTDTYGLLYSWSALTNTKNGGSCPAKWKLSDTTDWFNLARIIVGNDNVLCNNITRISAAGETETGFEAYQATGLGRFLKSDNGVLWTYEPTISNDCNSAGMNVVPTGKLNTKIVEFGTLADFWTSNYVHPDSIGQGRRYVTFSNTHHDMVVSRNHNANLQCARCTKKAESQTGAAGQQVLQASAISVSPNPAQGFVTITTPGSARWSVSNSTGVLVRFGSMPAGSETVNISSLSSGIYIVSVYCSNTVTHTKVLKSY